MHTTFRWPEIVSAANKIKASCDTIGKSFDLAGVRCEGRADYENAIINLSDFKTGERKAVILSDRTRQPDRIVSLNVLAGHDEWWEIYDDDIALIFTANDEKGNSDFPDKDVIFKFYWYSHHLNPFMYGELSGIKISFIEDEQDELIFAHPFALNPKSRKSVIEFMHILEKNFGFEFYEQIDPDKKVAELLELSNLFAVASQL